MTENAGGAAGAVTPVNARHWQERLDLLADKHGVAGAVLGLLVDGEVTALSTGSCNLAEGIDATPDSLFQIGSITKVWTATMIMQLVDEGKLELDVPVTTYLPGVTLPHPGITVRHLLTHTSGIDGDHFLDTGPGDDTLEKYAASLAEVAMNHPLGATMSYCNAGYSLLGRVIEVLDGKVYDVALQDRLCRPLGLTRTYTLPDDVIRFRNAVGHEKPGADEPLARVPRWGIWRASGPAGLINAQVADLLAFARLHLAGGVAADGTRVLSEASVAAMQVPQVAVPDRYTLGQHWGLGWILYDWDGTKVIGHDGSTFGQNAYLKVFPEQDMAVALLTNGGAVTDLQHDLFAEIFEEVVGVRPTPPPVADPDLAFDPADYTGVYEREGTRIEFIAEPDGSLRAEMTATGPVAAVMPDPTTRVALTPFEKDGFLAKVPGMETALPVIFYQVPGAGSYVHLGARATPKKAV